MKTDAAERSVILIPSLEPDERLPAYIRALMEKGFSHVVVVDDGSPEKSQIIFQEIESMPGTAVLHHDVNHGKGVALKTGYRYIMEHYPDALGVITADADGQHSVKDCLALAEKLEGGEKALYLGSRDFDLPNVPPKSRKGNKITSAVFKLLYGQYLPDTQTGLRAFRTEELPFMTDVEGERYEYEMKVLISCSRAGIPMIPVTIDTIYENDNAGTHFHPIRDSWRIYKVILGTFFKFMANSLICVALDQIVFNLVNLAILHNYDNQAKLVLISTICARIVSSVANFSLNRHLVFGKSGKPGKAFFRYAILTCCIMLASAVGTWLLGKLGISNLIGKMVIDTLLYFVSYHAQSRWVFREE